jgi:hypothetical protein
MVCIRSLDLRKQAMNASSTRRGPLQDKIVTPVMFFLFWLMGFWFMLHAA